MTNVFTTRLQTSSFVGPPSPLPLSTSAALNDRAFQTLLQCKDCHVKLVKLQMHASNILTTFTFSSFYMAHCRLFLSYKTRSHPGCCYGLPMLVGLPHVNRRSSSFNCNGKYLSRRVAIPYFCLVQPQWKAKVLGEKTLEREADQG